METLKKIVLSKTTWLGVLTIVTGLMAHWGQPQEMAGTLATGMGLIFAADA